jgi:hypothetical protein
MFLRKESRNEGNMDDGVFLTGCFMCLFMLIIVLLVGGYLLFR